MANSVATRKPGRGPSAGLPDFRHYAPLGSQTTVTEQCRRSNSGSKRPQGDTTGSALLRIGYQIAPPAFTVKQQLAR